MNNEFEDLCKDVINEGWRARFKDLRSGIRSSVQTSSVRKQENRVLYNNIRADGSLRTILEKFRYRALRAVDKDTELMYKNIKNMSGVIDQHISNVTEQISDVSNKYKNNVDTKNLESQFSGDIDKQLNIFRNDIDSAVNKLKQAIKEYQFKT